MTETKRVPTDDDLAFFYELGEQIEFCKQGIEHAPYAHVPSFKEKLAEAEKQLAQLQVEFDFDGLDASDYPGSDEERSYYDA